MSDLIMNLVDSYGFAENRQDDGQALYARNLVEVKIAELNAERDALELRIGAMIVERSDAFFKVIQERDALKSENGSLRELMNTYNIGGWTDSLSLIEERGRLKAAARLALDALVDLKGIRMNEVEHLSVLRATNALKAVL